MNVLDIAGQSPLFYASAHGHSECVKLLLNSGANPDLEQQRIPPLHAAAFEGMSTLEIQSSCALRFSTQIKFVLPKTAR